MGDDRLVTDDQPDLLTEELRWWPAESVSRHSGDPIEPDADFFAAPPLEIGELITAETTLKTHTGPWRTGSRIALAGLAAWGTYMLVDLFAAQLNVGEPSTYRLVACGVGALLALVIWFVTRFSHTCSFVGKLGTAKFQAIGSRVQVRPPEVFLFEDAAELRTSQTRHYNNGVYMGTNYAFTWTDHSGNQEYKLSGTYRGEKKPPKAKDPFHFAQMAEMAWSAFLFDQVIPTLESTGAIRFNLSGSNFVAIGPGFLDLRTFGTDVVHLDAREIGGMQIDSGLVKIKRIDAQEGWFSSTGVYKFNYEQMANTRLFMLLYARLIGEGRQSTPDPSPL